MSGFLGAADGRPSLGVEIELGILRHGQPIGQRSALPARLLATAQKNHATLPRHGRHGLFTCAGLFYHEMHRFLEAATWPACDLPAVLRQEDAALLEARGMFLAAEGDALPWRMACYPDDLGGTPVAVRGFGRGQTPSASMGTHINLLMPRGADKIVELLILLAAVLPEIVGPGGFVQRPEGLEFWRDPRSAHVCDRIARAAHDLHRPVLKHTDHPGRLQIVSLGHARSRVDRVVKYGLLLLLACHATHGGSSPRIRVDRPDHLLHAPPGRPVGYRRAGRSRRSTRLGLLTMLLDEVLEPASRTELGRAADCGEAIQLARRLIGALATARDAADVVQQAPTSWSLKQNVLRKLFADAGAPLPTRRWLPPLPTPPALLPFALLPIVEACVLHDDARRYLLAEVDGMPFRYDDVYGVDAEARAAVQERRLPRGAIEPGPSICSRLLAAGQGPKDRVVAADWAGVLEIPLDPRRAVAPPEAATLAAAAMPATTPAAGTAAAPPSPVPAGAASAPTASSTPTSPARRETPLEALLDLLAWRRRRRDRL